LNHFINKGAVFALPALVFIFSQSASYATPKRIRILHLNDLQSCLLGAGPNSEYTPTTLRDDDTLGGIARMSTLLKKLRSEYQGPSILIDAGDFTMGSAPKRQD